MFTQQQREVLLRSVPLSQEAEDRKEEGSDTKHKDNMREDKSFTNKHSLSYPQKTWLRKKFQLTLPYEFKHWQNVWVFFPFMFQTFNFNYLSEVILNVKKIHFKI